MRNGRKNQKTVYLYYLDGMDEQPSHPGNPRSGVRSISVDQVLHVSDVIIGLLTGDFAHTALSPFL